MARNQFSTFSIILFTLLFHSCTENSSVSQQPELSTEQKASIEAFERTLYPLLQKHCSSCHGRKQHPLHSSANMYSAHETIVTMGLVDFSTPANSRLVQTLRAGHRNFPASLADDMEMRIAEWSNHRQPALTP